MSKMSKAITLNINLSNEEFRMIQNGAHSLYGLIKDTNNNKIVKHLPTSSNRIRNTNIQAIMIGLGAASIIAAFSFTIYMELKSRQKRSNLKTKNMQLNQPYF